MPNQENFFKQQTEAFTENHNQSKCGAYSRGIHLQYTTFPQGSGIFGEEGVERL